MVGQQSKQEEIVPPGVGTVASPTSDPQAGRTAPKATHLQYLDGIRAVAALYVVWIHAVRMVTWSLAGQPAVANATFPFALLHFGEALGQVAVAIFITLSGFCLMLPVLRSADGATLQEGVWFFLLKRALRILPPYFMAILFSVVLIVCAKGFHDGGLYQADLPGQAPYRLGVWDFVTHGLLIQDLFPGTNTSIDTPLWSVAAEWRIYLLFPLLLLFWRRIGAVKTVLATLVLTMTLEWAGSHILSRFIAPVTVGPWHFVPEYTGMFALGALGAAVSRSARPEFVVLRNRIPWTTIFYSSGLLLVLMTVPQNEHFLLLLKIYSVLFRNPQFMNVDVALMVIAGLISFANGQLRPLQNFFAWKPLALVGGFSYSLYLIHFPIEFALYNMLFGARDAAYGVQISVMLVLSTVATTLLAYVFFYLIERPSHAWAKSVGKKR